MSTKSRARIDDNNWVLLEIDKPVVFRGEKQGTLWITTLH